MRLNSNINERRHDKLAYTVSEAAYYLNLSEKSIYRLIQRGELRTCPLFRTKMIPARDVEEFYEKNSITESF
jgi:excisionase family DNA binding protein